MYQLWCQTCFSAPYTQYGVKRSLLFTGPTDHWFFPYFWASTRQLSIQSFLQQSWSKGSLKRSKGKPGRTWISSWKYQPRWWKQKLQKHRTRRSFPIPTRFIATNESLSWVWRYKELDTSRLAATLSSVFPVLSTWTVRCSFFHHQEKEIQVPTILPLCHQASPHPHNQSHA